MPRSFAGTRFCASSFILDIFHTVLSRACHALTKLEVERAEADVKASDRQKPGNGNQPAFGAVVRNHGRDDESEQAKRWNARPPSGEVEG